MPCDIERWRRKRSWEKDQAALAREKGGMGFATRGHPARQVWAEWDDVTFPGFWDWVLDYRLLTDTSGAPLVDLNYETDQTPVGFDLFIASKGFNTPQVDMLGREFTVSVNFTCIQTVVEELLVITYRQTSVLNLFKPLATDSYRFEIWASFINEANAGTPLTPCTVYPLDRCHDCTDPP